MNKKFMVVALMAALSTIGYAFEYTGNGTVSEGEHKGESHISGIFNKDQHIGLIDGHFNQVKDELNKLDQKSDFNDEQLNNKLNDEIKDREDADKKLEAALGTLDQKSDFNDEQLNNKLNDEIKNREDADKKLQAQVDEKADKDYVDGKVTELGDHVREEMDTVRGEIGGVKAEVYENKEAIAANKVQIDKNTAAIENHEDRLTGLENNFAQYDGRLSGLEKKVDHLDDKMNKGLSLMAAMNAVDFQNVQTGEMALGAGIGHYGNAQSVALGVAYAPVEDLTVNAKYSITAGDPDSFAVGAGATYKFKVGR